MMPSANIAVGGDDELMVRTVVYVEDEIDNSDGTPCVRTVTTHYVNPENVWPYWHYRTTLFRKYQKDRTWTVVELFKKFKDMHQPFGVIDRFLITILFEDECEPVTLYGVQPPTLLELGFVMIDDGGDVLCDQRQASPVQVCTRSSHKQTQRFP